MGSPVFAKIDYQILTSRKNFFHVSKLAVISLPLVQITTLGGRFVALIDANHFSNSIKGLDVNTTSSELNEYRFGGSDIR